MPRLNVWQSEGELRAFFPMLACLRISFPIKQGSRWEGK
jgi:hypothetical protein